MLRNINNALPGKAYHNDKFLDSPAARNIRILAEMLEPADRLRRHNIRNMVVFFGSARTEDPEKTNKILNDIRRKIKNKKNISSKLKAEFENAKNQVEMAKYYGAAVSLAEKLTRWFNQLKKSNHLFAICSGGGPGIMEAANRGAKKAKGMSIGLNISLPMEQTPNKYIDKDLCFEFHYFFIRKFWFFYMSKCIVIFPGGFGTMDEFFELLTLMQTGKSKKKMPIVLFGGKYWNQIVNFNNLIRFGMINKEDLDLFKVIDDVDEAFAYIKKEITERFIKTGQFTKF